MVEVFAKTDVGKTRDHNEDCFLVADLSTELASLKPEVRRHTLGPKGTLMVVADGMGGAAAGEVASALATKTIYEHLVTEWLGDDESTPQRFAYRLKEAAERANQRIHDYARQHPNLRGMGTTATAVGVFGDHLYLTQVGDSRAYLLRRGTGIQLTKDQSLMQRLVDAGEISEEEAEQSDRRNIILQALGPDSKVRVDLTTQQLRRGDMLVLCSDGLSGQVTREEITRVASKDKDLADICTELIDLANERGGPDNITVVVARFAGDRLKDPGTGEQVGHRVYPLLDPESTTEPVPIVGDRPPPLPENRQQLVLVGGIAAAIVFLALLVAVGGL